MNDFQPVAKSIVASSFSAVAVFLSFTAAVLSFHCNNLIASQMYVPEKAILLHSSIHLFSSALSFVISPKSLLYHHHSSLLISN